MNSEELKQKYSMRDIIEQYDFKINRSGFINCPFHQGDKDASLKIYKDSFYCFGCGASGDIFTFIQLIERCDFKKAFLVLGGTYGENSMESRLIQYHVEKQRIMRKKEMEKDKSRKKLNNMLIDIYRYYVRYSKPLSNTWCDCYNALQYQLYLNEKLSE